MKSLINREDKNKKYKNKYLPGEMQPSDKCLNGKERTMKVMKFN